MKSIKWTKNFLDSIKDKNDFLRVEKELNFALTNIHIRTKQIKTIHKNVRRLRIGSMRLFLFVEKKIIYVLAYLPRNICYKSITIKNLKEIIKRLEEEGL